MIRDRKFVLVHLASGVGNIVLATPLLVALARSGFTVDLLVDGDYSGTADLLREWSAVRTVFNGATGERHGVDVDFVIPAIPPFYWNAYRARYAGDRRCVARPPDTLFYADEQRYYLEFAQSLGCEIDPHPQCFLPIAAGARHGVTAETLVLAPGCKTGEMAAKRWPFFAQLAEVFRDVAVVGTADDMRGYGGELLNFPRHVQSFVDQLSLRETAELMAAAGIVVANDSGLGHIAAALGIPTLMIFGPTPNRTLGRLPPNVKVLRSGLACEPCWFAQRFHACRGRIDCLARLTVEQVYEQIPLHSITIGVM